MKIAETPKRIFKTVGVVFLLFILVLIISILRPEKKSESDFYGYPSDGHSCDYGYNPDTQECCQDDDYTCEVRDKEPKGATALCEDGTYSLDRDKSQACIEHGGIETDPQYTPYK